MLSGKKVDTGVYILSPFSHGYKKSRLNPYMHVMAMHVPEMTALHGNIKQFSCQGKFIMNDDIN